MPKLSPDITEIDVANLDAKPTSLGAGFVVEIEDQVVEGGFDPAFGDVTWKTLISGCKTASTGVVLGVATFPPNGVLHLHRHTPPEFYYCIAGFGEVVLDGVVYPVSHGSAVYIPSDVEHGVYAGPEGLSFVYGFGEDAFATIEYRFLA